MNKKGFTLIELLAVIIILAIVALIATPIVLNVVDDAKKSAAKSEASMILSGITSYCSLEDMKVQMGTLAEDAKKCGAATITAENAKTMYTNSDATVSAVTVADGKYTFTVTSNGYNVKVDNNEVGTPAKPE